MSLVASAVSVGTAYITSKITQGSKERAASDAAGAQTEASRLGIEETRRQFDEVQELLAPFVEPGQSAIEAQANLLGLRGTEAQETAISAIEESPIFESIVRQGEEGILQSASATGGLRGGNVQRALSEFRPEVLQNLIGQQFDRLGQVAQVGQSSAAREAVQGQQASQTIAELMQRTGSAQAAEALARGTAEAELFGDVAQQVGTAIGSKF